MGALEEAIAFDADDKPQEAVSAYRRAIAEPRADLDAFINLAVLYFVCHESGYAHYHQLPKDFSDDSFANALETLDQAEERHGATAETRFWRRYIAQIYQGGAAFDDEALRMVESGETSVPYFYLLARQRSGRVLEGARMLVSAVRAGRTAKERYIRSILLSHANRKLMEEPAQAAE